MVSVRFLGWGGLSGSFGVTDCWWNVFVYVYQSIYFYSMVFSVSFGFAVFEATRLFGLVFVYLTPFLLSFCGWQSWGGIEVFVVFVNSFKLMVCWCLRSESCDFSLWFCKLYEKICFFYVFRFSSWLFLATGLSSVIVCIGIFLRYSFGMAWCLSILHLYKY